MIRLSHAQLYTLSGAIWFIVGILLLNLGLQLILQGFQGQLFFADNYSSFFSWLSSMLHSPENTSILLIVIGIGIGFFKGRFVLHKVAMRSHGRIEALENPTSITNLYTKGNCFMIAGMMFLGMMMRYFQLPCDLRGLIDTAVGTALMQGAISFFHLARQTKALKQP